MCQLKRYSENLNRLGEAEEPLSYMLNLWKNLTKIKKKLEKQKE